MTVDRRFPPDVPKLVGRVWTGDADKLVQKLLEQLVQAVGGLPTPHAETHMGGSDDLAGTVDPTDIAFGLEADPGTPSLGFAPIDHVHELDADLAGLEELSDVTTETIDGRQVGYFIDPIGNRLLAAILLELKTLLLVGQGS